MDDILTAKFEFSKDQLNQLYFALNCAIDRCNANGMPHLKYDYLHSRIGIGLCDIAEREAEAKQIAERRETIEALNAAIFNSRYTSDVYQIADNLEEAGYKIVKIKAKGE